MIQIIINKKDMLFIYLALEHSGRQAGCRQQALLSASALLP